MLLRAVAKRLRSTLREEDAMRASNSDGVRDPAGRRRQAGGRRAAGARLLEAIADPFLLEDIRW
jgi:hypothetical protein